MNEMRVMWVPLCPILPHLLSRACSLFEIAVRKPSKIDFGIGTGQVWEAATNSYTSEKGRHADVYIFCLLAHRDKATVDPMDLDHLRFFVVSTAKLDQELGKQKTLSLSRLLTLEPREVGYGELGAAIMSAGAAR